MVLKRKKKGGEHHGKVMDSNNIDLTLKTTIIYVYVEQHRNYE